ncbi:hypothetical protein N0V90_007439 [Kalmusia sp. IMI 367209]|nr:hypothetical protein N0V90_007439 [Kalmusia sp. IMI 367209]
MSAPREPAPATMVMPASEVRPTDNTTSAATPMSMAYLLNPSVGMEVKDPITSPSAPIPTLTNIAPATPPEDVDTDVSLRDPSTSPAPSTGDARVGVVETGDVEEKINGNTSSDGTTAYTFHCMNDEFEECRTGQTTMDLSRKVISDHFGRNKACTRLITEWPLFCRKHYQRATYNQKLWQTRKITLILRQFDIIEAQFPGTKYTVALKKSEEQRLNTFSRKVASGKTEEEAADIVAPEKGKHFEAPVNVLREIEQLNYLGEDKTKDEVEQAVNTIKDMLDNEDTDQVPSIEFLPQLDTNGIPYETRNKTPKNSTTKARVSAKGGVKKSVPNKKTSKKGSKA